MHCRVKGKKNVMNNLGILVNKNKIHGLEERIKKLE